MMLAQLPYPKPVQEVFAQIVEALGSFDAVFSLLLVGSFASGWPKYKLYGSEAVFYSDIDLVAISSGSVQPLLDQREEIERSLKRIETGIKRGDDYFHIGIRYRSLNELPDLNFKTFSLGDPMRDNGKVLAGTDVLTPLPKSQVADIVDSMLLSNVIDRLSVNLTYLPWFSTGPSNLITNTVKRSLRVQGVLWDIFHQKHPEKDSDAELVERIKHLETVSEPSHLALRDYLSLTYDMFSYFMRESEEEIEPIVNNKEFDLLSWRLVEDGVNHSSNLVDLLNQLSLASPCQRALTVLFCSLYTLHKSVCAAWEENKDESRCHLREAGRLLALFHPKGGSILDQRCDLPVWDCYNVLRREFAMMRMNKSPLFKRDRGPHFLDSFSKRGH